MATPAPAASPSVQHVAKKSSDQLLQKFAHLDSRSPKLKSKRRITVAESCCRSPSHGGSALVERRSLLPLASTSRSALLRQLGIARARLKARDIRNRSVFGTLEKTWRSTVEGASRVFMEKHYHRHKRLISDIV
ncbi:uncharacterized protein LOC114734220 [Neltuma alba]|uniref:uncharacterized protein LOC114734220 n=1 Tax=Neltuma alba TaxID=207710 RepID=UPI0010A2CCE7|nr:uncharacterized protein LOC114734220 [Prosopis alba]